MDPRQPLLMTVRGAAGKTGFPSNSASRLESRIQAHNACDMYWPCMCPDQPAAAVRDRDLAPVRLPEVVSNGVGDVQVLEATSTLADLVHRQIQVTPVVYVVLTSMTLACRLLKTGCLDRIVKWWRGDNTPDSLERPPTEPGQGSEAQQAEQAAKDATQSPQAGVTSAAAQQPSAGQRAGGRAAPSTTDSTTGQTSAGQRTGSSRSGQASGLQTPASSKSQSPSGWLSWLGGGRTAGSQQVRWSCCCSTVVVRNRCLHGWQASLLAKSALQG